jgi:hypothetical protein
MFLSVFVMPDSTDPMAIVLHVPLAVIVQAILIFNHVHQTPKQKYYFLLQSRNAFANQVMSDRTEAVSSVRSAVIALVVCKSFHARMPTPPTKALLKPPNVSVIQDTLVKMVAAHSVRKVATAQAPAKSELAMIIQTLRIQALVIHLNVFANQGTMVKLLINVNCVRWEVTVLVVRPPSTAKALGEALTADRYFERLNLTDTLLGDDGR